MGTSRLVAAWAAGFVDGEGCISINRMKTGQKNINYALSVRVSQTDPRPLIRLKDTWGGSISHKKPYNNGKFIYEWRVVSKAAELFIRDIIDYLTVKSDEAKLALYYRDNYCNNKHKTDEERSKIDEICDTLSLLKKRNWEPDN